MRICPWYGAKKAALSLRFDDSHTTHIERALPMLNEFGFVGTFLINSGIRAYKQYAEVWEGPAALELFDAPNEEHIALAPVRVGSGFRFTMGYTVDDLETLAEL